MDALSIAPGRLRNFVPQLGLRTPPHAKTAPIVDDRAMCEIIPPRLRILAAVTAVDLSNLTCVQRQTDGDGGGREGG